VPEAKTRSAQPRVSIRPGVGILSVLRHLNYKPWFAMAEFVDNSLQSYLQNREELQRFHSSQFRLKVKLRLNAPIRFALKSGTMLRGSP
jgi:hypothetical protein